MTRHLLPRPGWAPWMTAWPPWLVLGVAAGWGESSQQQAQRNAMVASSVLLQRRRERLDVAEFLDQHAARRDAPVPEAAGDTA